MIIQCKNCSKKFLVKDTDIPNEGRMVECGYCSQKWFQASVESNVDKNISKREPEQIKIENVSEIMEFEASDGRTYKFLGSQWAELLPSGKTGVLAKRRIATELNKLAGIVKPKSRKKMIDPSSEQIGDKIIKKKPIAGCLSTKKGSWIFWLYFFTDNNYIFYCRNFENLPKRIANVFTRITVYF